MNASYRDRWIRCTPDAIRIRGYYFPWGTKRIPYGSIRSVRRVEIAAFTGKGRVWGTANPRYWASLDPRRPQKTEALILDLGRPVKPFITPMTPAPSKPRSASTPTSIPQPTAAREGRSSERETPSGWIGGDPARDRPKRSFPSKPLAL